MSFSLFPFILILLSLAVIVVIIIRRFSQLTLLDVDNIPEVKHERKKDDFWKKRASKQAEVSHKNLAERIKPIAKWLKRIQLAFRKYVGKVEREVMRKDQDKKPKKISGEENAELAVILKEAHNARQEENYDIAEEKYIAVIKIDQRNQEAYRGLGDVYLHQGHMAEAEETYKFLLQLNPHDDATYAKLGQLAEEKGDLVGAVEYYQQAVLINDQISTRFVKLAELLKALEQYDTALEAIKQALEVEPNNPKYIDILTELAILVGDKKLAEEAYNQLRMVNPENQKLEVLIGKIHQMK